MKIYIDRDNNQFISDPGFKAPLNSISLKRGDSASVEITLVTGNTSLSAVADKQIVFGIKPAGAYDADYIVYADEYSVSGTSYVLPINLNTVALNTLLNSGDGDATNDVASVEAMLEVSISEDSGVTWYSTNVITAVIHNDVNKGGEGTPVANQTMLEWLETYRPAPLVLSATPSDYFPETITIDGNVLFHAGGNNWSTDGSPETPPSGTWYLLFYTGTSWSVDIVVEGIFSSSFQADDATPATVFPNFVSWTGHTVTGVSENHTDGKLGQDAIVNETDVYKCVSETPVKWKVLS